MSNIIIRHDDFDFRLDAPQYIAIHEEFVRRGLIETAVIQFAQFNRFNTHDPETIKYLNESPNYDLQLHGWQHANYAEYDFFESVKELSAAFYMFQKFFNRLPTIWYPPWNCYSPTMQQAAEYMGLTIDNESYDISKFIREVKAGTYLGHSFYFHGWKSSEVALLPEALDLVIDIYGKGV